MKGLGLRALSINFASTFARQIGSGLIQLTTVAIIARIYGAEGNGMFALALLLPSTLATFLNLGVSPANVYFLGSNQVTVRVLLYASLRIHILLTVIGLAIGASIILLAADDYFPNVSPYLLWLALACFPLILLLSFLASVFQGLQKFKVYNLILIVQPSIMLLLVVIVTFWVNGGVTLLICSYLGSVLITVLLAAWQLPPLLGKKESVDEDSSYICRVLGYGWKAHLGNILAFINYKADIFLVNYFIGTAAAGVYVIALTLAETLWLISQASSTVLLPRLSQLSSDEKKKKMLTPFISRWVLLVTLCGGFLLAGIGHPLIELIFGAEYLDAVFPLLILLPGVVLFSAGRVLANDIASRGRPDLNLYIAIVVVAVNVIGNIILIPLLGLPGAALATTVAYTLVLITTLIVYSKLTSNYWIDSIILKFSDIKLIWKNIRG